MAERPYRKEELRIDGKEIKTRLREAARKPQTETREFHVSGKDLVEKVKQLLHAGNIRRITVRNASGETVLDIPLTLGLAGVLLLRVWAIVGTAAALALDYTISVEKSVDPQ